MGYVMISDVRFKMAMVSEYCSEGFKGHSSN